jgi:hypothetical protein
MRSRWNNPFGNGWGSLEPPLQGDKSVSESTSQPIPPKLRLRWYQYSLRTLFVFVTLCAVACSWFATEYQRVQRRHRAFEQATEYAYTYGTGEPEWYNRWLYDLVGDERCARVEFLIFNSQSDVTDEDMKAVGQFEELLQLSVPSEAVSDRGLESIEGLTQLVDLGLSSPNITDAGLSHLKGMKELRRLHLGGCTITDAGLEVLRGFSQLEYLDLAETGITDAGLERLQGLRHLEELDVTDTRVTAEGVKKLRRALPNCKVHTKP